MSTPDSDLAPPVVCNDKTATIAAAGTTSGEVDLRGTTLCGIDLPSTFTGTALTFLRAPVSGGTFKAMGTTLTVTQNTFEPTNPDYFLGVQFLKIQSNATEGSQRVLTLATRPLAG